MWVCFRSSLSLTRHLQICVLKTKQKISKEERNGMSLAYPASRTELRFVCIHHFALFIESQNGLSLKGP